MLSIRLFPFRRTLRVWLALPLFLTACPFDAQAQPGATTTKARVSRGGSLEDRLAKARRTYDGAVETVNFYPVYFVQGKVVASRGNRITVYGTSVASSSRGVGWNGEDTLLTIYNVDLSTIQHGQYNRNCVAISQTEFEPPPKAYFEAVTLANKYAPIVESIQSEIAARNHSLQQMALKRQQQAAARLALREEEKRASVLRSRSTLANTEWSAALIQNEALLARSSQVNKPALYEAEASRLIALSNKWGRLGVNDNLVLARIAFVLLSSATLQARQGRLEAACAPLERLLSLELLDTRQIDAQTGRPIFRLVPDPSITRQGMPATMSRYVLHLPGANTTNANTPNGELKEVATLAREWLEQLPRYVQSSAPATSKARVMALSQVLVARVFASRPERLRVVATALTALPGGAQSAVVSATQVPVSPALEGAVKKARADRAKAEAEAFLQSLDERARTQSDPQFFRTYAREARELYAKLTPQARLTGLLRCAVVQQLRAATLSAQNGQLDVSMDDARAALWSAETPWNAIWKAARFEGTANAALEKRPEALGELMAAWTGAFPAYAKRVDYSAALRTRKFGEVLLRSSDGLVLPEKAGLQAVLEQPLTAANWKPHRAERATTYCSAPAEDAQNGDGKVVPEDAAVPQTKEGAEEQAVEPVMAPDFQFRSFKTRRASKLSDFRGKVVLLYFWDLLGQEFLAPPTPEEKLFALSKKYDPKKVVLLLINKDRLNPNNSYLQDQLKMLTAPDLARQAGLTPRVLPAEVYAGIGSNQARTLAENEQFVARIASFYLGNSNILYGKKRVTVINASGEVSGHVDFEPVPDDNGEVVAKRGREVHSFEFDDDALDTLIIDALTPSEAKAGNKR